MVQLFDLSESIKRDIHATSAAARLARALEYGLAEELCAYVDRCFAHTYDIDLDTEEVQKAFVDMRYDLDLLKKQGMEQFLERHELGLIELQVYCSRQLAGRKSLYDRQYQHTASSDVETFTDLLTTFLLCSVPGNQYAFSCVKGDNPMSASETSLTTLLERLPLTAEFKMAVVDAMKLARTHTRASRRSTKTMIERLISLSVITLDCYAAEDQDVVRELLHSIQEEDPIIDSLIDSGRVRKEVVSFPSGVLPFCFLDEAARVYTLLPGEGLDVTSELGVLAVVLRNRQQLFSGLTAHD